MKKYQAVLYDIDGTLLDTIKMNMNMIPLQKIIQEELHENRPYEKVLKFASYLDKKVMEELSIKNPKKTMPAGFNTSMRLKKGLYLILLM